MSIIELLEDLGPIPSNVKERLEEITEEAELSRLHKVAAKASSMQEFEKELNKLIVR